MDGFNLYYGALKGTPWRWLDLRALLEQRLRPRHDINCIRYFTARVSNRPDNPGASQRQDVYLRALQTLPGLTLHFGEFRTRPTWLPLVSPAGGRPRFARVLRTEEKGSDVNLASFLLHDGHLGRYECAVVVSNDSDLRTPLALAKSELGKLVGVINPSRDRAASSLAGQAHFTLQLGPRYLGQAQFPRELVDRQGSFHCPPAWAGQAPV